MAPWPNLTPFFFARMSFVCFDKGIYSWIRCKPIINYYVMGPNNIGTLCVLELSPVKQIEINIGIVLLTEKFCTRRDTVTMSKLEINIEVGPNTQQLPRGRSTSGKNRKLKPVL